MLMGLPQHLIFGLLLALGNWAEFAQAAEAAPSAPTETLAPAAAAAATAPLIRSIEVRGLRRVDAEAALVGTQLHVGMPLETTQATHDVRALWQTGFFRDVALRAESRAEGIHLIYLVEEKPAVHAVQLSGFDDISEDDIRAVLDVKPFTILNVELLKKNVQKIRDLYVDKGYYLAEVSYRVEPLAPVGRRAAEVNVHFDIVEKAKVVVRQISFIGNRHVDSATLKQHMQTREGSELTFLNQAGTYKEEYFQTDLLRLQALYYDRGYVSVKISPPAATISKDRREIYLSLAIEEGEAYDIGRIEFSGEVDLAGPSGAPVANRDILREHLSVRSKKRFCRTDLFNDVQKLTDLYRDYGYAYANVTPNSNIDAPSRQVNLDFEVERGALVHIESIEMSGNSRTRDKVIRRELRLVEGDVFSAAAMNRSRERVFQLGYFETVNMLTEQGSAPDRMKLVVEVKEKSTGTFQVGAGLSSYESFIATAQISQNNFLGNGQLMSLSLHLSFGQFAQQMASFQFTEPYFLDSRWSLGINAYLTQRLFRDFQRQATGVSPSFGYPLTHELRLSAGYTLEYVSIVQSDGSLSYGSPQKFGKAQANSHVGDLLYNLSRAGRVGSVNGAVSFDNRDNRLFPTHGTYDELRAEVSTTWLGATEIMAFKRLELMTRFFHPLPLRTVFRFNMQLGYVFGPRQGVPISERYFPGGIYSVRGFSPRGLGPKLKVPSHPDNPLSGTRDFIIGGNKQAIFNVELEFPLVPAAGLKGVLFADAGNAYNDDEGMFYIGTGELQRSPGYLIGTNSRVDVPFGLFYSVGFGVRWLSPIGPLRFEWGIPITKHDLRDDPLIFEFTIGNFF
jgi:outer membrane protein insertion porin family